MAQPAEAAVGVLAAPVRAGGRFNMFRALRNRNYRMLWLGQIGHSASAWMEQVARPLLALALTGSALQVGLVVAVRMVPVLAFGLIAGVVADRYDKRRILMYSQAATMLMHLALGVLVVTGRVQMWHIFLTAFVSGGANAFNHPVRQAIVPRLVSRADVLNAVALNQAAMNVMRVLGAGLAGLLLIFLDYGDVYLLNGFIYVGVIWTTIRMTIPPEPTARRHHVSLLGDFLDGFRYVGKNPKVLYLVATALLLIILGQPYQQVFIPLLAIDVLGIGRSGVGLMLSMTGLGAVVGSLVVAARGNVANRESVMIAMLVVFSLALIALAQSSAYALSMGALFVAGGMSVAYMAMNNSLLLEETPHEFHGRVMSLMSLDRGLIPLGAIVAGVLAEAFGPQFGLTIMAGVCLGLTGLTIVFLPRFRRADATPSVILSGATNL